MIELADIYDEAGNATPKALYCLWRLLKEREPHQSISHKAMPSWRSHERFVDGHPYFGWWLITVNGQYPRIFERDIAGSVYLTRQREIGVGVLKACRGQGLARAAIAELMRLHPGRFFANINPANAASIALFRKLGFGGPIQITLEKT